MFKHERALAEEDLRPLPNCRNQRPWVDESFLLFRSFRSTKIIKGGKE